MEPIKEFSCIQLTLENCIIPEERLRNTPSLKDGITQELEVDLRVTGCEYIQSAGLLLKLPQVAMATAQILFQRFYYAKSFVKFNCYYSIIACLFLASKIEEANRRLRDVINVFHHLRQKKRGSFTCIPMDYVGEEYYRMRNNINKYERYILKELGFCVHVQHPHKLIIICLQILEHERNKPLVQKAWNYMNDCLRTNIFVRYSVQTISSACIFLAARQLQISLPENPPWWELLDVQYKDMKTISLELLALYKRPKRSLVNLEKDVEEVKQQILSKSDSKVVSTLPESTPPSQTASPRTDSPFPGEGDSSQKATPQDKATSSPSQGESQNDSTINKEKKQDTTTPVNGHKRPLSDRENSPSDSLVDKKPKRDPPDATKTKPIISPIKISSSGEDDEKSEGERVNGLPSRYHHSPSHESRHRSHKHRLEKRHRSRSPSDERSRRRHRRHSRDKGRSRDYHDSKEYRHHHR